MTIERCPITPIRQCPVSYNRVYAELLEELSDYNLQSPEFVLDLAVCYAKVKIISERTPAKTCINEFCKTHNIHAEYRKLQFTFLGPGFTQHCSGKLEDKLCSLKYWENLRATLSRHMKSATRRSFSEWRTSRKAVMLASIQLLVSNISSEG